METVRVDMTDTDLLSIKLNNTLRLRKRVIMKRNKLMFIAGSILSLALLICLAYIGCGGGGGGSSSGSSGTAKLTLTGAIGGSGYHAYFRDPRRPLDRFFTSFVSYAYAYGTGTDVDKIIALKCLDGRIGADSMQNAVESVISSDNGSFNLVLEKDTNWILMLVNSAGVGDAKFVGYVALDDGLGNSLLQIPVSTASDNSLDLGNLISDTDMAISDNTAITASTFAMSASQLTDLARNDDFFKYVKNFYLNYNNGIFWTLTPNFKWTGDYTTLTNTPVAPAYTYYSYGFPLFSNSTDYDMDDFCGTNGADKVIMALHPPLGSEIPTRDYSITYTYDSPLSNTSVVTYTIKTDGYRQAGCSDMYVTEGNSPWLSYDIGPTPLSGTIPAGLWTWAVTNTDTGIGTVKGQFDMAVASPITGAGMVKGFVPVLKVNLDNDTNRLITSIDVIWFGLNDTGDGYDLVTDISVLKYLVNVANVELSDSAFIRRECREFNPSGTAIFTPVQTWYYNKPAAGDEDANYIHVAYSSGGVGFMFSWDAP